MPYGFLDIALTPGVVAAQARMGVDQHWQDFKGNRRFERFTEAEAAFIAERDSFYMATVSETGWPYVQHRGGPRGFLKLVDDRTLAFADYRGNLQYISTGNIGSDDKVSLILMDYARRARLKLFAHAEIVMPEDEPELARLVAPEGYRAKVERIFRLRLEAFDWNCPQHIIPRFTAEEVSAATRMMQERIAVLEAENAALKARLAGAAG
ncbi:pyridoxamine 5'-phosphate oxidase family protein [Radicibacter daui]|uniref:pyridoxamine 5'-phosphate oxidase family protein n=1 Tax=Radicibacter daui TaxID=3064829 RepID=UPI00404704D4